METTYYTLTAKEIMVAGDAVASAVGAPARQLVCVRKPAGRTEQGRDNVIDLTKWKAAREEEARLEEEWYAGVDQRLAQPTAPAERTRREHPALLGGELLATLSVIGAMAMLMVRILMP
jgi:hypothetical protein